MSVFPAALIALLVIAAASDLANRTISNYAVLAVALAGLIVRVEGGSASLASVWAVMALVALLVLLYSRNLLGGGDVKLMAALSLALTATDCYRFVTATALSGGVLAMAYLLLRNVLPPLRCKPGAPRLLRIAALEGWRIRRGAPLPYGLAIAAGGIFVLLHPAAR